MGHPRFLLVVAVLVLAAGPALAEGNTNFILVGRSMNSNFHEPVREHAGFGVTFDFGAKDWPLSLAAGFHASRGTGNEGRFNVKGTVAEASFGVMKLWESGTARPYVGGGVSAVWFEGEVAVGSVAVTADDTAPGLYLHGGVFWRRGEKFNIGFDGRLVLGTDITIAGVEGDADYAQFGLLLGWGR